MGVDELQGVVGGGAAQVDHEGSPLVHRSGPVVGVAGGEIDLNTGASEDISRKAICFIFINVLIDDSPASATNCFLGPLSRFTMVDNGCDVAMAGSPSVSSHRLTISKHSSSLKLMISREGHLIIVS